MQLGVSKCFVQNLDLLPSVRRFSALGLLGAARVWVQFYWCCQGLGAICWVLPGYGCNFLGVPRVWVQFSWCSQGLGTVCWVLPGSGCRVWVQVSWCSQGLGTVCWVLPGSGYSFLGVPRVWVQ
ncbi:unnamed protein product, partial [Ranitomeya imitator]